MSSVIWFANWSENNPSRTIETKMTSRLRDAKDLLKNRHGYVVRQDEKESRIVFTTAEFLPGAIEEKKMRDLTNTTRRAK